MRRTCQQIQELMLELVTGTLSDEQSCELQQHLSRCPKCSDYLAGLRADDKLLSDFAEAMGPTVSRLESNVLTALHSQPPGTAISPASMWRKIGRQTLVRLSAAAAIVIGVFVGIQLISGPPAVAPAFARMVEAMGREGWVHKVETKRIRNKGRYEEWIFYDYCDKAKLVFRKSDKGDFSCQNYANCTETYYDPQADAIVVSYSPDFQDPWWRFTPQSLLDRWKVNFFEKEGTVVTHKTGKYDDIDSDFYCATQYGTTKQGDRFVGLEFELVVDRNRHLPLATAFRFWRSNGTQSADEDEKYDYPEKGPNDIYELGCPKTAKVFDNSPTPELLQAVAGYLAGRENSPLRYIAILVCAAYDESSESHPISCVEVHYCDDYLQRADWCFFRHLTQQQFTAEAGDSFDSIMKWCSSDAKAEFDTNEGIRLFGEEYVCWLHRPGKNWVPGYKGRQSPGRAGPRNLGRHVVYRNMLSELGWTDSFLRRIGSWKISRVENDHSGANNLIRIEVVDRGNFVRSVREGVPSPASVFYLDPQRDYICQKYELYPRTNRWYFAEVLEYGRTESGQWYPRKILRRENRQDTTPQEQQEMITVYLDTDPEFPPGIFNPDTLPR